MDNKEKKLRCNKAHLRHITCRKDCYCKVYSRRMPLIRESCRDCSFSTDIRPTWLNDKKRDDRADKKHAYDQNRYRKNKEEIIRKKREAYYKKKNEGL